MSFKSSWIDDPCDPVDPAHFFTRSPLVVEIQKAVAEAFEMDPREMTSPRRHRAVARPRQIAMYLAKRMTPRSLAEIGRRFGGRDHSTVLHAIEAIDRLRRTDGDLDNDVRSIMRAIESRAA